MIRFSDNPNQVDEVINFADQLWGHIQEWWNSVLSNSGLYVFNLIQIIVILLVCKFALSAISRITTRIMQQEEQDEKKKKRTNTIMTLIRSVSRYGIYFIGFALVLDVLGFGNIISSLVLTAGVGSLAIGFGAQSLVKDVVTGLFLMFENQFSVGDFVKIDNLEGTIEAMAMRVTYLRNADGNQVIIPNGTISRVINVSRGDTVARVLVSTRYEDNTQEMISLVETVVDQYAKANKSLLKGKPTVQGIVDFSTSSVDIRVTCTTKNMKHWEVERGIRLAIKNEFDQRGIQFPYQTISIASESKEEKKVVKKKQTKKQEESI